MSEIYKNLALSEIKASTHRTHPDTSREAAERVQPHVGEQATIVLREVHLWGPRPASHYDEKMDGVRGHRGIWRGWAHKRMKDLADAGFVERKRKPGDHELTCTITKAGIEYLEGLK